MLFKGFIVNPGISVVCPAFLHCALYNVLLCCISSIRCPTTITTGSFTYHLHAVSIGSSRPQHPFSSKLSTLSDCSTPTTCCSCRRSRCSPAGESVILYYCLLFILFKCYWVIQGSCWKQPCSPCVSVKWYIRAYSHSTSSGALGCSVMHVSVYRIIFIFYFYFYMNHYTVPSSVLW